MTFNDKLIQNHANVGSLLGRLAWNHEPIVSVLVFVAVIVRAARAFK